MCPLFLGKYGGYMEGGDCSSSSGSTFIFKLRNTLYGNSGLIIISPYNKLNIAVCCHF